MAKKRIAGEIRVPFVHNIVLAVTKAAHPKMLFLDAPDGLVY